MFSWLYFDLGYRFVDVLLFYNTEHWKLYVLCLMFYTLKPNKES